MLIHRNSFDNWQLTMSGSATATVTDSYFEYSAAAAAVSTLKRNVLVFPGQTLKFRCMASTSWQNPRIQFSSSAGTLLNYVDMDLIVGTQACELQWTKPLTEAADYVTIEVGSVSGLNGAGIITEAEVFVSNSPMKRVIAECTIKIENGVASIDGSYDVMNVEGVTCDSATIVVDMKTDLIQGASGFVKPTVTVSRVAGGPLSPPIVEFSSTYAANKISITAVSISQNVTTKDISFPYYNWAAVSTAVFVNVIVYQ